LFIELITKENKEERNRIAVIYSEIYQIFILACFYFTPLHNLLLYDVRNVYEEKIYNKML